MFVKLSVLRGVALNFLLADDHALFREGLAMIIKAFFPTCSVKEVGTWTSAHEAAKEHDFEVALLDLSMPGLYGWEQELSQFTQHGKAPVCVVSALASQECVRKAFASGARGYVTKGTPAQWVGQALNLIMEGNIYMPDFAAPQREEPYSRGGLAPVNTYNLSSRQLQVLALLAEGKTNREMGGKLGLSEGTVKRHLYNIFQVLGVKSRIEAVNKARLNQLLIE